MRLPSPAKLAALPMCAAVLALTACGAASIQLPDDDPDYAGAELFVEHCSGCHTFEAAGTEGSAAKVTTSENKDGPNFNQRKESEEDVLFAIENGGFSGAIMPQNIVVGAEAEAVARFLAEYAGNEAESSPRPGETP